MNKDKENTILSVIFMITLLVLGGFIGWGVRVLTLNDRLKRVDIESKQMYSEQIKREIQKIDLEMFIATQGRGAAVPPRKAVRK